MSILSNLKPANILNHLTGVGELKNQLAIVRAELQAAKANPQGIRYIQVPKRHAGVYIDHDVALTFSAVFRAIAYISSQIACLPWHVLLETGTTTKKLVNHQVYKLLKTRPNPEMGALTFRETLTAHALSWGNGYAEIERNGYGTPLALWLITPDRVTPVRRESDKKIIYVVANGTGPPAEIESDNMFHVHGLGFDGLSGYSVISFAARSIALGIAAETYGEDFFSNGAVSTGALKHPEELSPEAKDRLRDDLNKITQGAGKRFNIPIFEEGMDWIDMMIKPEDAQLVLTRQFQVTDVARWFGLPPHKLADMTKANYNNIEHLSIEVVNDALMPWVLRYEQEADYKLIKPTERGVSTRMNLRGLLRGDNKSRAEYYKKMREMGAFCTDDILLLEDMDPIGGEQGGARIVPGGYQTLKQLIKNGPQGQQGGENEPDNQSV